MSDDRIPSAGAPVARLFVYGTLMRGLERFGAIEQHVVSCSHAEIRGRMLDLGPYPGLIPGEDRIKGELLVLEDVDLALSRADEVEGFRGFGMPGSFYERRLIEAESEGERHLAWCYMLARPPSDAPIITSGDWRAHVSRR